MHDAARGFRSQSCTARPSFLSRACQVDNTAMASGSHHRATHPFQSSVLPRAYVRTIYQSDAGLCSVALKESMWLLVIRELRSRQWLALLFFSHSRMSTACAMKKECIMVSMKGTLDHTVAQWCSSCVYVSKYRPIIHKNWPTEASVGQLFRLISFSIIWVELLCLSTSCLLSSNAQLLAQAITS